MLNNIIVINLFCGLIQVNLYLQETEEYPSFQNSREVNNNQA